jgi:hypothetical protein
MIGRADIEGSKSNVAMNAWLPQASYPCGNFSDTSSLKLLKTKGSIGHAFTVCIHTENQNQMSFFPFDQHEISVLIELILGHLRYLLTDVPPQPNSPPDNVFDLDSRCRGQEATTRVRGQATARWTDAPFRAHRHLNGDCCHAPFLLCLDPDMRDRRNSRIFALRRNSTQSNK